MNRREAETGGERARIRQGGDGDEKPVLVVMAAGMGSRFGGLKQITPVDEQGDILMDFSLYDARRAGFETVVFVIKEAIAADFRAGVGDRMARHFDVRYTFQELDRLPAGYSVPEGRVKPWGTGHAIACAAEQIDGPFAVINADDFYGRTAFREIYDFLIGGHAPSEQAMVGYLLRNTVTENGFVTRGVCQVEDGYLTDIVERTHIERRGRRHRLHRGRGDILPPGRGERRVHEPLGLSARDARGVHRPAFPPSWRRTCRKTRCAASTISPRSPTPRFGRGGAPSASSPRRTAGTV